MEERVVIGETTNAEIISSDKRARISGGLYVTFRTSSNVVKDNLFEINVDDKWHTFKVTDIKIDGDDLLIQGHEYGYWAHKLDRKTDLDLRNLISRDVAIISDSERINKLREQACWC